MSNDLIRYDAACRAIAQARATDEVLRIRDQGGMLRAYAKQAKNRDLEITATEIRMRAERRIGELIQAQREQIGLAKGQLRRGSKVVPRENKPTLADAGIDKHLADRARKLAAIPAKQFEDVVADWREQQSYKAERASADLARRARPTPSRRARRTATKIPATFSPDAELAFEVQHRIDEVFFTLDEVAQTDFIAVMEQFLAGLERRRRRPE